jgi:transposase
MAGRPRKLTVDALAAARASVVAGMSVAEVAPLFSVSRATLYRHLNDAPLLTDSDEIMSP